MKAQFLKLAGVKDEKSFYKLFPDEKSFMAKYGKQIKKAEGGINYQFGQQNNSPGQLGYNLSGDLNKPQFNLQGDSVGGMSAQQNISTKGAAAATGKGGGDILGKLGGMINVPGQIIGGIQKIIDEKKQRKIAQQWNDVSKIQLDASRTKDIDSGRQLADNMTKKRQMMMPVNTGEEFFPIYGVGTEPLAKEGKKVKSKKAMSGAVASAIGGGLNKVTPAIYGDNGGSDLGGTLGGTVGSIFGPVGSLVGEQVGKFAGWALDPNPRKTKKLNNDTMQNANMMAMSNMGNEQTSFMRAGGHLRNYTAPSEEALQTFDMGGDLQTHWGGYAEPLSNNPYSQSPTVMFRGQSHDESVNGKSGIGMTYGNAPVEVERGEPAQEFRDGGTDKSLVVFGNLPISNQLLPLLGDPDAKGKKFKNYIADLSKKESVQNKTIDKSVKAIDEFTPRTPYEKLTFESHTANIKGADMNLKQLAQKKETAAALQQAINDSAEEHGLIADDLAQGKIKYAKLGTTLHKAVDGGDYGGLELISKEDHDRLSTMYDLAKQQGKGKAVEDFQKEFTKIAPKRAKQALQDIGMGATNYAKSKRPELEAFDPNGNIDSYFGKRTEAWKSSLDQSTGPQVGEQVTIPDNTPDFGDLTPIPVTNKPVADDTIAPTEKQKYPWMQAINSMVPYLRPSDAEELDPRQLSGEMFAMAHNQQEPVPMQTFQPQLTVPYDISYQDQLNENTATFRAAQRNMGHNPAAQANLAAQQYQANEGVLGEQFRANQSMKNQTYAQNRQALDNAQLLNLQAYDQQTNRQSQAKSNTKEVAQTALNSISDKFMKNKLENRTLQTYENMYNYRFGPNMRAQNMNPLAEFSTDAASSDTGSGLSQYEKAKAYVAAQDAKSKEKVKDAVKTAVRNGAIVSSFKKL